MHHRRPVWVQPAIALLLALALTGCFRSASGGPNPLPSMPPSTSTLALAPTAFVTKTLPVAALSNTNTPPKPTERPGQTESPRAVTATPTTTEVACEGALPTRLRLDAYAYVDPDPPLPNNLRSEAGTDNELIGEAGPGQAMQIVAGPKCVDGSTWWQVRTLETELVGWTAEGNGDEYWLVPCASEQACGTE